MKRWLLATVALASATQAQVPLGPGAGYRIDEPMPRPADMKLVWGDEFDGPVLDTGKWAYETAFNKPGWFNNEKQYYAAERTKNVRLEGGKLILEAHRETTANFPDSGGQAYTSGRLTTAGLHSWTYGYYEIRAKLPCARGTWPAIWMMPAAKAKWPEGGEIDIMEHVGMDPRIIHANLHTGLFNHVKGTQRGASKPLPTACDQFHDYQLHWQPGSISIGFDGQAFFRVLDNQPGGGELGRRGAWPFDGPFHLILNLAMGGDWAGQKGIDNEALPQRMEVDHVRIWQKQN